MSKNIADTVSNAQADLENLVSDLRNLLSSKEVDTETKLYQLRQRMDDFTGLLLATDVKVLQRALRLGTPEFVGRHIDGAEGVFFLAGSCHVWITPGISTIATRRVWLVSVWLVGRRVYHYRTARLAAGAAWHPTAWLLALIGTALVFPIVWLVERIKDSRTTAATSKTATVHQARFLASQPQESKEEQDDKHEPTDTSSTGLGLS